MDGSIVVTPRLPSSVQEARLSGANFFISIAVV